MFYYYGRKKKLAPKYPQPLHPVIVEPFAGSAAYSLHGDNWKKTVILSEINAMVYGIWKYLQSASKEDILKLPDPPVGTNIRETYKTLSIEELDLMGLHTGIGKPTRRSVVGKFSRWGAGKKYISENIHKVKHWQIHNCHYKDLEFDGEATWFIDPPYQHAGVVYKSYQTVDYDHLKEWTLSRKGLVIACGDYDRDTWLPFVSFDETKSAGTKRSKEGVYIK